MAAITARMRRFVEGANRHGFIIENGMGKRLPGTLEIKGGRYVAWAMTSDGWLVEAEISETLAERLANGSSNRILY